MIQAISANKVSALNKAVISAHRYCETIVNDCIKEVIKDGELKCCFVPLDNYNFPVIKSYLNKQGYNVEIKSNNIVKISW